jgi:hypothetical protein
VNDCYFIIYITKLQEKKLCSGVMSLPDGYKVVGIASG